MDLGQKILGKRAFNQFMKMTFYGQFVAGEDHMAIRPLIQKNEAFGVGSVLDYSVEEDISQEEAEQKEMKYETYSITIDFSRQSKIMFSVCFCLHVKLSQQSAVYSQSEISSILRPKYAI